MKTPSKRLIVLLAVAALLLLPLAAQATMVSAVPAGWDGSAFSNTISSPPPGVVATDGWSSGFSITSTVTRFVDDQLNFVYEYDYSASVPVKAFSHIIIGVTLPPEGTTYEFWQGTVNDHTTPLSPALYTSTSDGNSNPGLPDPGLYGIKFGADSTSTTFSFFSFNAPVWQDFYAKDGTDEHGTIDVYAYNSGFGNTITPYAANYIIGPDSVGGKIPVPPTVWLLGSGLIGMGLLGWRRRKQ